MGTHLSSKLRFVNVAGTMRTRYRILEPERPHFVTATIVEWLPVFNSAACCEIIVRSLEYSRSEKALKIYAWVIMENHIHAVLSAPDLSSTLRDIKSFTAREIVTHLKTARGEWLLNQFSHYKAAHKPNEYQVWQEGSHPQAILTDEMMLQKMDYLHNNPVKRGWVASPEHWRWSSAHEWLPGAVPVLRCDSWRD